MTGSLKIELRVDPLTGAVTRDGAPGLPLLIGKGREIETGDGEARTLADIVQAYADAVDFEDVRESFPLHVQQAIGEALFTELGGEQTFGEEGGWLEIAVSAPPTAAAQDMRRFLERLPWPFLARPDRRGTSFLVHDEVNPWLITLNGAPGRAGRKVLLPPEPRMLLMITALDEDAGGEEHERELLQALAKHYSKEALPRNIRIGRRWAEMVAFLEEGFHPSVIYFYGHGESRDGVGELHFLPEEGLELPTVTAAEIGRVLREMARDHAPPDVFFANCCHGSSAARFGLGEELSEHVACLIANRTVAVSDEARKLGVQILDILARDGASPDLFLPQAMSRAFRAVPGAYFGGRWACPVVYTNYDSWVSLAPEKRRRPHRATAGDFPERVDRKVPLKAAMAALGNVFQATGINLHGVAWQAEERQGLVSFGRRLRDNLRENYTSKSIREVAVRLQSDGHPALPPEGKPEALRQHCFKSIFGALADPRDRRCRPQATVKLDDVVGLIEGHAALAGTTLLFLHEPTPASRQELLRAYWVAWSYIQQELVKRAEEDRTLAIILAFPLEVGAADKVDLEALLPARTGEAESTGLDVFGNMVVGEIAEHLRQFSLFYEVLTSDTEDKSVTIFTASGGEFEKTYLALKEMADIV